MWDIRRNLFTESVVKLQNGLPRERMESPSLKVYKEQLGMTLITVVELSWF